MSESILYQSPLGESSERESTQDSKWYEALKVGDFYYPPGEDESLKIDEAFLDQLVANYQSDLASGNESALDVDHTMSLCGGPAYGWIKGLARVDGKLLANVKLNGRGINAVASDDYKYLSSEFAFDWVDIEKKEPVGPKFLGLSLVNRPHIPGLKAITLSLKQRLNYQESEVDNASGVVEENNNEGEEMSEQVKLADQLVKLSASLEGKSKEAQDAEAKALARENELKLAGEEIAALRSQLDAQQAKLSVLEAASKEMARKEAEHEVDERIRLGRATNGMRTALVELSLVDREKFEAITKDVIVPLGTIGKEQVEEQRHEDYITLAMRIRDEQKISWSESLKSAAKVDPVAAKKYFNNQKGE